MTFRLTKEDITKAAYMFLVAKKLINSGDEYISCTYNHKMSGDLEFVDVKIGEPKKNGN